jgi:hypothetical protein
MFESFGGAAGLSRRLSFGRMAAGSDSGFL